MLLGGLQIAMFGQKHVPSRAGGVEVVVGELAVKMAALGNQVTCFNRREHHVPQETPSKQTAEYYGNVRLKSVPTIDKKGLAAVTSSFFAALQCAVGPYDVVHCHAEGPAAMCWLLKLFGKRCIVTVHGLDWARSKWKEEKGGLAVRYIRFGEKVAVRYADEIIVLSQAVRDYFEKTYGRATVHIPNGVNRPDIVPPKLITSKFGLQKDGYILYLGRIVPEKGLGYLIHVYMGIDTNKKLVIAGGASDTEAYMQEIRRMAKNDDRIVFTGFVQGPLLDELYSNAYLYVLPSDLEGMPLSLLEAMSYGNCCLTSNIPECTEVIEDQALTFARGDEADLRLKLMELLDDNQMVQSYKLHAADFICRKYSWDYVAKKTFDLYIN